ncbi:MAG: GYF domain-containing protein [Oligoflexia bacterium]|nr:GYF domain-containing protein [Oligoflexia bacterium]
MENTGKVLFKDESPQWFVALGNNWIGPLPASDVYQKIVAQEISWAHYVWRKGQRNWVRICDTPEFQAAAPSAPGARIKSEVTERSQSSAALTRKAVIRPAPPKREATGPEDDPNAKIWYLHWNDTQYGPFSTFEIEQMIAAGRINGSHYLWKEKMTKWERIEKLATFAAHLKTASPKMPEAPSSARANKRHTPRKPLLAKIYLAHEDALLTGVCRDISIGGMQVLTDRVPASVGAKIKLNVSPADSEKSSTAKATNFKPFVAEGVIVRVLEDGRGFSFRFDKISDAAKRSIEAYIQANA